MIITPSQFKNPLIKPKWTCSVGVMESIIAYNCRKYGFPQPIFVTPMWEKAGNRTIDFSGHQNHGKLDGTYNTWKSDSIQFERNNSADGINIGHDSSLEVQEHTLFCIAKSASTVYQIFFAKEWIATDGFEYGLRSSKLAFAYFDTAVRGWYQATNAVTNYAEWNSYAASWRQSDGEVDFFYNGKLDSSIATTTGTITHNSTRDAKIGDREIDPCESFDGQIKCQYLFPLLTIQQVKFLHDNPYFMFRMPEELYGHSVTASGIVGISGNGTLIGAGKSARSSLTTATANGALTVAAVAGHLGDGAITTNGDLTLTGLGGRLGAASITANGTLTLSSVAGRSSAVGIEGNGDLIGAGLGGHTGTVLLSKNGELTVVGSATSYDAYGTVAITGNGSLIVTGGAVTPGAVVISAGGNLAGAGLKDQMFEEVWLDSDLAQGVVSPSPLWRADCGY